MYCYKCGSYNEDDCIYCFKCGTLISSPTTDNDRSGEMKERVRSTIKRYLASPMLLIALILMTVSIVTGFIPSDVVYHDNTPEYEDEGGGYVSPLSYELDHQEFEKTAYDDDVLTVFGFLDLNAVWLIAGWIVFFLAKTKKSQMKTGGLGMATVLGFINRIRCYIICVLLLILMIGLGIEMITEMVIPALIFVYCLIFLPMFAGIGFLFVFWSHKLHRTIKSIAEMYKSGETGHPISVFVSVIWFISGILLMIAVNLDIFTAISMITYVASNILMGIQLIRLRAAMKALDAEQKTVNNPVYTGQINYNEYMI